MRGPGSRCGTRPRPRSRGGADRRDAPHPGSCPPGGLESGPCPPSRPTAHHAHPPAGDGCAGRGGR
ncbi:hypothetical protein [Ornithinimicrobium kibberense]|uniref:hypothetical protein n=1 Tax=Ornithinimicrobium kibberense TaxID=282060 RepID=UPI00360FC920